MNESVNSSLYSTIKSLMEVSSLDRFLLGGGTNLAIKYNYRVSTDIDLFCPEQVTVTELFIIKNELESLFGKQNVSLDLKNKDSKYASFLTGFVNDIKVDIIHNIPFTHRMELRDNIRLVNDLDIGALKLISVSNRGSRKDFYDLFFLSEKYSLDILFDEYIKRIQNFSGEEYQNLFNISTRGKPTFLLHKDCSRLGDFTNANLNQYNNIKVPNSSPLNTSWFNIREKWKNKVIDLSQRRNIIFEETTNQRKPKFRL